MSKHNEIGNNNKHKGETAQKFVIAEFASWNIEVALPMSDNLPFDLIAIYNNKLYRIQVKSSGSKKDAIEFSFRTSNWWKKTSKKYTELDADIMVGYDVVEGKTYLFGPEEFVNRRSFTIRRKPGKRAYKTSNLAENYVISENRINEVFQC